MPTVLITGGTGMIGTALGQLLIGKGYEVLVLSRGRSGERGGAGENVYHWDPDRQGIDPVAIRRADYIVHLAGTGVADKRWSAKRKEEIVKSRTESSALIAKALREIPNRVRVVVSISGIGWYGPDPKIPNPHPFAETDPADAAFLGETCRLWEEAIAPVGDLPVENMGVTPAAEKDVPVAGASGASEEGHAKGAAVSNTDAAGPKKRLIILRTGIVLSREGGALAEFKKPVRLGVAAILGSGKQVVSWIHIDDLCRLFLHAIEQPDWRGVYNAVSPYPVDNRSLTRELARRFKGKYFVQVYIPTFLLKMAVGGMSIEVLKSATVSAEKSRRAGFQFNFPSIESALDDLLAKR